MLTAKTSRAILPVVGRYAPIQGLARLSPRHVKCMPSLLQECRRSNLTFIACQGTGEPIRLDLLRRVREPVSRSKSGVQGKVADVVHGRSRHAESQNELRAFQILMATAHAHSWQEQPFILEYPPPRSETSIHARPSSVLGGHDRTLWRSRTIRTRNHLRTGNASLSSAN